MFKKFNWGHGITVFYICFVAAVATALVASFGVDHSLVVDDYYAKDLAYQSQYEKVQNNLADESIIINNDKANDQLIIEFPDIEDVEGTVFFYRPSDKSQDFKVQLQNKQSKISTDKLIPGKWILKIDWTKNGKPLYKEEMIYL